MPALTLQNVDDIYEVRFLVEPEAARQVATQVNEPATLAPVMRALESSVAAHKADQKEAFIDANARFRYLLAQGQPGLSVAFDLPTQMGLDSDDPRSAGEVGQVGVVCGVD